jgi:aarF domain-containing kinase
MAGRRIVDAAKLFNASRSIVQQHVQLRSQQLDVYSKTSSLAKAAKSQTDRVTLTLDAALALSKRLNEEVPRYASAAAQRATGAQEGNTRRSDNVRAGGTCADTNSTTQQDHRYGRAGGASQAETPPANELNVQQEDAPRRPLPDGTIPSAGMTLEDDTKGHDTFSNRTVPEPPKEPLANEQIQRNASESLRPTESRASTIPTPGQPSAAATGQAQFFQQSPDNIPSHANEPYRPSATPQLQRLRAGHDRDVFYARSVESEQITSSSPRTQIPEHTGVTQKSDDHVQDSHMNQDVYYSVPSPGKGQVQKEELPCEVAVPEQDHVPEGINTDVFRTQRVAKMLGGNPYKHQDHLDLKDVNRTPQDRTNTAVGHDQDTFNVRNSEQLRPSVPAESAGITRPATTQQEMQDLASELAKDTETAVSPALEVYTVFVMCTTRGVDMLIARS